MVGPNVLFEDELVLIIDKPSGIVVNRSKTQTEKTIEDWLAGNYIESKKIDRCGIVHRLDKETSGILLIAKTVEVQSMLQEQFANRLVSKRYKALVHGTIPNIVKIDEPIGRNPYNRERFTIIASGREAHTIVKPIRHYQLNEQKVLEEIKKTIKPAFFRSIKYYTLVDIFPKTGRTHQIRVHTKAVEFPVVSDPIYGGRKIARFDRLWCPRLFLHAESIAFRHPSGEMLTLESPLPVELMHSLKVLTPVEIH